MRNEKRNWPKRLLIVLCVLAIVWIAGCGVIYAQMRKPPEQFGMFMKNLPGPVAFLLFPFETLWTRARAGTLQPGDAAPDFALAKLHESERVRLSELNRGRPVVLLFGSYT